jgi:glycosyltransferase involved in cell wall biosynthesis
MRDLSILIPARNEMFLRNTVEDILKNIEADTEVIVLLDGEWASPGLIQSDRVNIIYVNKAVGQRAGVNLACRLSRAKYVMKVDAHCSFDKGFDRKMLEAYKVTGDNVTMVPTMRNLWVFEWVCYHNYCGWTKYQGPTPLKCGKCGRSDKIRRRMKWIGKERPQSNSFAFDAEPHFRYFNDYNKRPETKKMLSETGLTESMSLQGSAFMCTREKFWELDLGGEELGNWGNQGIQVACATWLSGGRVLVNHNTWYAHLFRTQGGDFGFPWPMSGRDTKKTKDNVRDLFWNKKHPKQIYPVSWLVEKFWPITDRKEGLLWKDSDLAELKTHEKASGQV